MDLAAARFLVPQKSRKRIRTRHRELAPKTIPFPRADEGKSSSCLAGKIICHFSDLPSVFVAKKKSPKKINKLSTVPEGSSEKYLF
jgi:hypothetical protein